jgi:hypothetical protein
MAHDAHRRTRDRVDLLSEKVRELLAADAPRSPEDARERLALLAVALDHMMLEGEQLQARLAEHVEDDSAARLEALAATMADIERALTATPGLPRAPGSAILRHPAA